MTEARPSRAEKARLPPWEKLIDDLRRGTRPQAKIAAQGLRLYLLDKVPIRDVLPTPDEVGPELAEAVEELWRLVWLQSGESELRAAWDALPLDRRHWVLVDATNLRGWLASAEPLLPLVREALESSDPDLAWTACNALGHWLADSKLQPALGVPLLLEARADARRARGKYKGKVAAHAILSLMYSASTPAAAEVGALLAPLLSSKKAADRKLAARFGTLAALSRGDAASLATYLAHADRSVRAAAADELGTRDQVVASARFRLATELPTALWGVFAEAVARGLDPRSRPSEEARALRASVFDGSPGERVARLEEATRASLSNVDLGSAAPHVALLLHDEDASVRAAAARALATICGLRVPLSSWVIADLVKAARPRFDAEPARDVDAVLRLLERRR